MKNAIYHNKIKNILCLFMLVSGIYASAQVLDPFTPRFNETVRGDVTMIANNMLSRTATTNYNGGDGNHDFTNNVYVDIDGVFDQNNDNIDDTFNSSSANLTNPESQLACLSIHKAYLYWAAADREPTTDPNSENQPNWNYNEVKLMLPGQTTYTTITADDIIFRGRNTHIYNDPYICVKDITNQVTNLNDPYGKYQIANVEAKTGSVTGHDGGNIGTSGGWQIVFVYESPKLPSKNISLFDGYANVTAATNNFDITFGGFQTVPTGNVSANVVIGSLEGDQDLSGDQLQIRNPSNNFVAISAPQRASNNFFNSRITVGNSNFTDRNPASLNTLGFDAAVFPLTNPSNSVITNNQTSATLRLTSNQETYGLYLVGLSVDVWAPDLDPIEIMMDSGTNPADPNDLLGFNFDIINKGNDNAIGLSISTTLPPQIANVVANNLPSGVTYTFNSNTGELVFNFVDGMVDVGDPGLNIDFDLQLQDECYFLEENCDLSFGLQFTASYTGVQNPNNQTTLSSAGLDDCNIGDKLPLNIIINQPIVNWATAPGALDTTISCLNSSDLTDAQNLEPEIDKCDLTLTKTSGDFIPDPNCPDSGTYTNTWSFTDECGETKEYTQTIIINSGAFVVVVPNESSTVSCIDDATETFSLPIIKDGCDNVLTPSVAVVTDNPDPLICEGTRTYTYTYTDCSGATSEWSYIYTIEIEDFITPSPTSDTVACYDDITLPTLPSVVDNCGNTLTPSAVVESSTPTCEGNITYTWTYTDCEGNSHDYVHTITIEIEDFITPLPTSDTVACYDDITLPTLPSVVDNCGNTLTPSAVVESSTPACEGDITYTWTYTDCEGNSHDYVHTITIEIEDFITPSPTSDTVACYDDITLPTLPKVDDNCGNELTPSAVVESSTPACEGDITYTWTYTDCEGNSHDYVHTVTIEIEDFITPSPTSDTVACYDDITLPTLPSVVDNCGNTLTPSAVVESSTPACEGDITYTWTYTDCEGNSHDYVHTITIEIEDFITPSPTSDTVACYDDITLPTLPKVDDNCGNELTPSAVVESSTPACEGDITYTWTYTDCEGNSHDYVHTITIEIEDFITPSPTSDTVACYDDITLPTLPSVVDNCGNTLTPSAVVESSTPTCEGDITYTWTYTDCEGNSHDYVHTITIEIEDFITPSPTSDTVACYDDITLPTLPKVDDNCGNELTPSAVVESSTPACEGDITYTWTYTDCEGNSHDYVHTVTIEIEDFNTPSPTSDTVACYDDITLPTLPSVVDNCGNTLTPSAVVESSTPACEGDITYSWTYTDCEGNSHDYVHTVTIEIEDFITPSPTSDTVACYDDIILPALPTVVDNCGNTLTPSAVVESSTPACEGDITYTWTYTDCEGNSHDYVHTVTIEIEDFITPSPTSDTVACYDDITLPTLPSVVDNCGNTLTPSAVVESSTPACEGNITYTWTYTDCEGNSHDYVHTITIEIEDFILPTNEGTAITCIDDAQITPIPPSINDNCGNTIIPVGPIASADPTCQGEKTYTWTYTDCEGNSQDWVFTYTLDDNINPTFNESPLPSDVTVTLDTIPTAETLTASDNCGTPTVDFNEVINGSLCDASHTIERTWTATDACGLITTHTQTITVIHPVLEVSIVNIVDVLCNSEATGAIDINVTGGTPPYTFSWNNSDTTEDLSNVIAGAYTLNVTDANGCTASISATVSEPANPLSINISKIDANTAQGCTNGEATVSVTGGTPSYTYLWSASAGNQTTATATNLSDGTHSVTVTDANGCELMQSIIIECVNTCDAEITIDDIVNVLCTGDNTGSGTVSASSDANPSATFTFTWSNGQIDTGVTSSTLNNITAGVYTVSVTIDGTVCQPVEDTISITEPSNALNVSISATDELGPGTNDGTATAVATGGVEPYTYLWIPNGETTAGITGLAAGSYSVTVTDANGCTAIATVIVNPGTCLNLSISGTSNPVICNGESNGSVTSTVSGGVGPFTYSWNTLPNTTSSVNNLPAGDYTITVTDVTTQCTQSTTITINEPNELSSGIAVTNILCKDESTGSLDLAVNGGTPPYTFIWSDSSTNEDLINVPDGTYSVTITDANGCMTTDQATIIEPNEVVSGTIIEQTNVDCLGNASGEITVEGAGGIPPYQYTLDGGNSQNNGTFSNLTAGNHTITITDANGCTFEIPFVITTDDIAAPEISVPASILIEGCSTADITTTNSIFAFSDIVSGDIQSIFSSNPNYNASDDFEIESITYIDVITSTNNCPIIVQRTFTIHDTCGNSATAIQTITVQDTTAPILSIPTDATVECTQSTDPGQTGNATATDNCGSATVTFVDTAIDACGNTQTITRTWTATDDCGNTISDTQTISVVDTTAPILNIPADTTVECTQSTDPAQTGNASATDTCGSATITFVDTAVDACGNTQTITRTWTATDDCGNTISDIQTISVVDTTAPILSIPADATVECTQSTDPTQTGNATATDTCGSATVTFVDTAVDACGNTQTITRTWTATDDCGNTTSNTQTISVVDTTAPILSIPADATVECTQSTDPAQTGNATATDTCGSATVTFVDTAVDACGNTQTITRTWTATDDCGNTTSNTQTISVVDTIAPDLSACTIENTTLECSDTENESLADAWNAANIAALEACATDACDTDLTGQVTSDYDFNNLNTTCGPCGNINVTYTVTDDCGNPSTLIATLTFDDGTIPDLSNCTVTDSAIECEGNDNQQLANDWNTANISALEDCADDLGVTVTSNYDFNNLVTTCGQSGTLAVIYTITDDCGNATTLNAVLTIEDTTAPTFTVPADITIECDVDPSDLNLTGDVTDEADNCSTNLDATFTDTTADGNCANESIITRTWSLTDDCDNTTTLVQTITVQDTTAPTFTVPADITIECDVDPSDLNLTGDVTDEADNCSTNLDATFTDATADGNCANESIITRTWSLTDDCDNTTTLVQTITVQDTTAPTFTVPADITIECDVDPSALNLTGDVTDEADNCSTNLDATFTDATADGSCANESIITRTWSLTDDCDNTTTLVQTITVQDTTTPTFTVPADITIECDVDPSDLNLTGDVTDEADNCSTNLDATFTDATADGNCANESIITRTWSLTDDCDNTTTLVQTITIQDTTAPTFTVPADITIECDMDPSDLNLTGDVTDEADNCSTNLDAIFTDATADGSCANESIITRTWSLTDDCDNTTTLVQTITIQDTTAPTFTVPADITIECDVDPSDLNLTGDVTDEADNCSTNLDATFTDATADGSCANESIITRTWSLTDDCDNTTTLVQTITIQDTTAPTFTVPADITIECDVDPSALNLTGDVTDEADNCSTNLDATFTDATADGSCANESIITRTWSLTDDCDNTTTLVQTITIQDTTAPTFTVPADITIECDVDPSDLNLTGDVTDEADNCSTNLDATFTDATADGNCANESIITRTWSLTDDCDNTTTLVQTITIQDTTAPTFTVPADITIECDVDPSDLNLTGDVTDEADNCSTNLDATFTDAVADGSCANESIITRTWSLTDDCDNTTTLVQTITVQDTTAPTFTVPADITIECDVDPSDLNLTGDVTDEADNCSTNLDATFTDAVADGNCANESIITRTWSLTDDCDNTTTLVQTITIQDTTAPTFTVPADITIECDVDPSDLNLTGDVTDEADNCSTNLEATFVDEVDQGDCVSIITRVWTVTDECDNATALIQTITIQDTTAPALVGDLEEEINVVCSDIPEVPELVFEDACSSNMTVDFNETSTLDGTEMDYIIIRDWFVSDDCGNEAIYTQTINVTVQSEIPTDDADLCIAEDFDFDLFDLLLGDYDIDGTWSVTSGNATIDGSMFNPSSLLDINGGFTDDQLGDYEFTYTYGGECPGTATVIITLNDECVVLPCGQEDVVISKAVTANFDGINEFFTISGVEDCGFVIQLQIFNRWGAKIYDNSNYQNDWNATASSASIGNSNYVPTGTYYYVIKLIDSTGDLELRPFTGPIYVSTK